MGLKRKTAATWQMTHENDGGTIRNGQTYLSLRSDHSSPPLSLPSSSCGPSFQSSYIVLVAALAIGLYRLRW